ncbi:unnamed protein product, partial [Ectocarpus sp. 4 AP-2014]
GRSVDFGSRAPIAAIQAAFELAGVPVAEEEARRPMGRAKRDHLQAILDQPAFRTRWLAAKQTEPTEGDLDSIYEEFLTLQAECVVRHSGLIDGCLDAIAACRGKGLKIGSSTGYTAPLLSAVAAHAAAAGYAPDVMLGADDVSPGRPQPWLIYENARRLGVYPMAAIAKVDDTPAGVEAGRNAGAWSVGVVVSGNEVGLGVKAYAALSEDQREAKLGVARQTLTEAGAHLLIDTIAELPAAVDRINA